MYWKQEIILSISLAEIYGKQGEYDFDVGALANSWIGSKTRGVTISPMKIMHKNSLSSLSPDKFYVIAFETSINGRGVVGSLNECA